MVIANKRNRCMTRSLTPHIRRTLRTSLNPIVGTASLTPDEALYKEWQEDRVKSIGGSKKKKERLMKAQLEEAAD